MRVKVNCKKKPVDYSSGDFRSVIRSRFKAKKTFEADYEKTPEGDIVLDKDDGRQVFPITAGNVEKLTFFLDGDRPYIEALTTGKEGTGFSFLIAPVQTNMELWQDGVIEFRESIDQLASAAGIEVTELIDPNPIGLCPDGVDDMEALIEDCLVDGIDILYTGKNSLPDDEATADSNNLGAADTVALPPVVPFSDGDEEIVFEDVDEIEPVSSPTLADTVPEVMTATDIDDDWSDVMSEIEDFAAEFDLEDPYDDYDMPDEGTAGDVETPEESQEGDVPAEDGQEELSSSVSVLDDDNENVMGDDEDMEGAGTMNVSTAENVAAVPEMPMTAQEQTMKEIKKDATDAMGTAYQALNGLKESLQAEKQRRVDEVMRLHAELAGEPVSEERPDITDYIDTEHGVSSIEPVEIESNEPDEVAYALREELGTLDKTADAIDLELNDYDRVISESKRQQEEFMHNLDNMDDHDAVVAGLISMYQEQTEYTEQMNVLLKKEQVLKHHAINQRDDAYKTIQDQKSELDKLRRSLRFSEQNKRKSEQFVKDAKKEIHRVVDMTRAKVTQAIKACEEMQAQVDKAEARIADADERRSAAELARIEAYKERDAAIANLEEEKQHTQTIIEEFDKQLDEFTKETVNKIQSQIERANGAEEAAAASAKRISDLESQLAETKTRLMASESKCSKKDVDISELRKRAEEAEAEAGDVVLRLNAREEDYKETGQILTETEAKLVESRGTIKRLEGELAKAKSDRDEAIAERLKVVGDMARESNDKVVAAASERDVAVANVVGAKDDAIAANERFIDAMSAAMRMSDGFGSRKKKLDAIAEAYNALVSSTQAAEIRGDVPTDTASMAATFTAETDVAPDLDEDFVDED